MIEDKARDMNTYTKAFKPPKASQARRGGAARPWFLGFALKTALMGALIFAALNYRISYSAKAENLNREASRIKMKLHKIDLEIASLQIRKDNLCSWSYIGGRIRDCNLALRPAESSQVLHVALSRTPSDGSLPIIKSEKKMQLTRNESGRKSKSR